MDSEANKREQSFWAVKKTERGWVETLDSFSLKLTPAWFDFVERLLLLGALKYLLDHGNNWFVTTIYLISLAVFFFYLQALLYSFPFDRFLPEKWKKSTRFASIFSLTVAAILLYAIKLVLNSVVAAFVIK
jgi:hypothetical protein